MPRRNDRRDHHALDGEKLVVAHVTQCIDQQIDRRKRQQQAQFGIVPEQKRRYHQRHIAQPRQQRLQGQRGGQVAVGVFGAIRHVADHDQAHAEFGDRCANRHHRADRAVDAITFRAEPARKHQLPQELCAL